MVKGKPKMRDRLIDLIKNAYSQALKTAFASEENNKSIDELVADHLLEKGVIVLPVPYGTELHFLWSREHADKPQPPRIHSTKDWIFKVRDDGKTWLSSNDIPVGYCGEYLHQLGKSVFLTKEEAERALERREGCIEQTI
jgi:hypothetical protein